MQHCSEVASAAAGTIGMVEDTVEEGIVDVGTVDVEIFEEVDYGETSFLDGRSSTQETKNFVGLVSMTKNSRI